MDVATIMQAFRCSKAIATASHAGINAALIAADCTTPRRCAMYAAQVGHETLSLYYDGEVWGPTPQQLKYDPASGSALSRQLGNTAVGDGYLYRGRGRVQLTGKSNFGAFSRWCHGLGLVPAPDYFVRHPDLVATAPWRDLAASWYWTVARPGINALADKGDVTAVTRLINGGTNGLADRQSRYDGAIRLGDRLLPDKAAAKAAPTPGGDWFDMATEAELRKIVTDVVDARLELLCRQLVWGDGDPKSPNTWGWNLWGGGTGESDRGRLTVVDLLRRANVETRQGWTTGKATEAAVKALAARPAGAGAPSVAELTDLIADAVTAAVAEVGPLYLTARQG